MVVEVTGGVAEVSYLPPGVEVGLFDHDDLEAGGLGASEARRLVCEARAEARRRAMEHEVRRERERKRDRDWEARREDTLEAAVELLCEVWEGDVPSQDRIDEVLAPVTVFSDARGNEVSWEEYRLRWEAD